MSGGPVMESITYVSENARMYANALSAASSLEELQLVLRTYKAIAPDALAAAPTSDSEFAEWRAGLEQERRGQFAGEEWCERWGTVLIPELMMRVTEVAAKYHVPWGLAFHRLVDTGHIVKGGDGVYQLRTGAAS